MAEEPLPYSPDQYSGYAPQQVGPQRPELYPVPVGANYMVFGEQPGWKYDPYSDQYFPDQAAQQQYYEESGIVEKPPKEPGMLETVAPLAVGAGVLGLASGIGENPGGFFGTIGDTLGGLGGAFSGPPPTSASPGGVTGIGPVAPGFGGVPDMYGDMLAGNALGGATQAAPAISAESLGAAAYPGAEAPGLFGFGGSGAAPATTAATETAPVQAAGMFGAAPGTSVMGSTALGSFLPALGAAAGAYTGLQQGTGLYDFAKGEKLSTPQKAALALPTFGASLFSDQIGDALGLSGGNKWATEGNRLEELQSSGAFIPQNLLDSMPTGGRSLGSLVNKDQAADFVGRDSAGNWVNNLFANDRRVENLRPEDIVNYATFAENDPNWFNIPLDQRLEIARQALAANAVKEHHGTIDVDFSRFNAAPPPGARSNAAPFTTGGQTKNQRPQAPAPAPAPAQPRVSAPVQASAATQRQSTMPQHPDLELYRAKLAQEKRELPPSAYQSAPLKKGPQKVKK